MKKNKHRNLDIKYKLKAIWELLRLEHGIMYAIGVLAGTIVAVGLNFKLEKIIFGMLAALFLEASGFALNDYFDYEVDLANKRLDRPLVRGDLSRKDALILALALAPPGFIAAWLANFEAFVFAVVVTFIGYIYDAKLKEFGFAGNIYIAFSMAAPFLFGSIVSTKKIVKADLILSAIAFLSGVGREIMKGIEDVEGDAIRNVRTIARVFGKKLASKISGFIFLIAVATSILPPIIIPGFKSLGYILPVIITDLILLKVSLDLIKCNEKEIDLKIKKLRKITLVALLFGLFGFMFGGLGL